VTPPIPDLFSPQALEEEAIARSRRHSNPDWDLTAVRAARRVAADRRFFTTDDVWTVVKELTTATTPEHRAMGAVMRSLALDRIAVRTDRTRPTSRPCANRRPIAIWRSLLAP
jgi:hypothetical protein